MEKCFCELAKNNQKNFVDSIMMLRLGKTKVAKEEFYCAKKPINICDVNLDNIVVSRLIQQKTNSKYLTGYLDKVY